MSDSTTAHIGTERPKRSGWTTAGLLAGMLALYVVTSRPSATPAGWGEDFDEAVAAAVDKQSYLIVAFHMEGCAPCREMERTVLASAEVESALKDYVRVRVDIDRQRELANRFNVFGTPTFAVINVRGEVLARCTGYRPVDEFLSFLRQVPPVQRGAAESALVVTGDP